ncbi:hypothetical protein ACFWPH_02120 [Nocardia sp. NPDC058499]|uniref:hypothetical protein n=1 Tax=Nocardia sp. NPDC058499 TaxID=3346530 RepID=UPI003646617F
MTELGFETSGHTGAPVTWLRTHEQLAAEAVLIADDLIGDIDQIVSFAPKRHLFGHLFGVQLPEQRGVPVLHVDHTPIGLPPTTAGKRTLIVCLPSSWLMLRHMLGQLRALPSVVALHSTGPTVPATTEVVSALADTDFRALELFGSTETGGIAYRQIPPLPAEPPLWTLLPDATFADTVEENGQWLHIRSPRLARRSDMAEPPESWRLPDLVHRSGSRSFKFEGRASALVKINGRRCNLDEVSSTLRTLVPGVDVACLPVQDPVRAENYELFYSSPELELGPEQVIDRLATTIAEFVMPRSVHRVNRIPRTLTGKVAVTALYSQIDDATRQAPAVEAGG